MVPPTDIGPAMDEMLKRNLKFKDLGKDCLKYLLKTMKDGKFYR